MPIPRVPVSAWPPTTGSGPSDYAPQNATAPPPTPGGPSIENVRRFQEWSLTQSQNPPPTWEEYQLFLHITRAPGPPAVGPPANGPAPLVLNTQLGVADSLAAVNQRMERLEAELISLKRKSTSPADGEDADDEDSDGEGRSRRPRKKARKRAFILCAKDSRLTKHQETVKTELRRDVKREMQRLTGIGKNPFPFHGPDEDELLQVPREAPAPAGTRGGSSDTDEEADDAGPTPAPPPAAAPMPIEWTEDIDTPVNALVWQHASLLVYQAQTNDATRTLSYANVPFTQRDIEELAKVTFRSWKKAYKQQLADKEKRAHRECQLTQQRRAARQRTLKAQRKKGIPQYLIDHGEQADPSCLLRTPWMSEAVSDWPSADEETRLKRKQALAKLVHRTGEEVEEMNLKILEHIPLGWRSQQLVHIYTELDRNACGVKRSKKKITYQRHARYSLGREREEPPRGDRKAYPFMVSRRWRQRFPARAEDFDTWVQKRNPAWYAPDPDVPDSDQPEEPEKSDEGGVLGRLM